MTLEPIYLGIDIGTSGVRGCCINAEGVEISRFALGLALPDSNGGQSQQHPDIWKLAVDQVIQHLCASIRPLQITALAIDGTSSSVLLCEANGQPCGPALMYNDQSSLTQSARIADIAPDECAAHGASSSLAKALQLLARYPDARHICHQADWVAGSLTGRYDLSDENNCLKLGYDPISQSWPGWLDQLNIARELLPEVMRPGCVMANIDAQRARQLGLPADCKIVAGTTDSIAAFIATGASKIGEAVTSLGSSIALKIIAKDPIFAPEYGIYSHRLGDYWLLGGASNAGGRVLLQHFSQQQLDQMTPELHPERATGLDYYPLPAVGERFPLNDPNKKPVLSPRPENDVEFFQAILEGLANIEAMAYHKLAELGAPKVSKIISAGGGSHNASWSRIRERVIGVPIVSAENSDACYGSALLALGAFKA